MKCPECKSDIDMILWQNGDIYECSQCGSCFDSEVIRPIDRDGKRIRKKQGFRRLKKGKYD